MQNTLRMSVVGCVLIGCCTMVSAQDQASIAAGEAIYEQNCSECHGEKLRSSGSMPDLRELGASERSRFDEAVTDGKGQMPAWVGVLSEKEIDQVWTYIRAHAR